MPKSKKTVAKAVAVEKNLTVAIEKVTAACQDGDRAVVARTKSGKRLAAEVRKLNRRRGSLLKRKVAAAKRMARDGSAANKKALNSVVKELTSTRKALTKAREQKKANTLELAALKTAQRKAKGYQKALGQVDRVLNKPKPKRRKRR